MNTTVTSGGFVFEGGINKNEEYSPLQKKLLQLLEGFCVFGYQEYYKNLLCTLVEAHKTIYGTGTPVQKKLTKMFHLSMQGMKAHTMRQGRSIPSDFQNSYWIFCNQSERIIHSTVTRPVHFTSVYLQCQALIRNLELYGKE
jgi:hypothetical protein